MAQRTSPPLSVKDSALSAAPPASVPAAVPGVPGVSSAASPGAAGVIPDAQAARNSQRHYPQPFRIAAVRYAATCGQSKRAAALDMGVSDKTLGEWIRDARPDAAGVVDVARFDELAQLREQNRELLARTVRLTAERDFLKKCASYFATPSTPPTPSSGGFK